MTQDRMQETEAKFYVKDLGRIELCLQEMKAKLIQPRVLETNLRFDLPGGNLRAEGHVLRLRRDDEVKLTFKGDSKVDKGALSRKEIEFAVGDFDKAKEFLEALGYRTFFHYEKYRTVYGFTPPHEILTMVANPVHVMLDELPYGHFVEIEGGTVESIQAVARALELKWEAAVPTSYHVLYDRLCKRNPALDPKDLSFKSLKGTDITIGAIGLQNADE